VSLSSLDTRVLEVRDSATFIPVLGININPTGDESGGQRWLMRRCGYPCDGQPNVILTRLDGSGKATNDPYAWGGRTYPIAHNYIIENWDSLKDGDVIDVEFILGEKPTKKVSERLTIPALQAEQEQA